MPTENTSLLPQTMPELLVFLQKRDSKEIPCIYFRRLRETESGERYAEEITADTFYALVSYAHSRLRERGIVPGMHVALAGDSGLDWVVCFAAVMLCGACAVLPDSRLCGEELLSRLRETDTGVLLYGESAAGAGDIPADTKVTKIRMDSLVPQNLPETGIGMEDDLCPAVVLPDDAACILFTSGTTGDVTMGNTGKAVVLSQRAMAAGICHNVVGVPFKAFLTVMPFHHIGGVASVWNTLYLGRVVCFAEEMKNFYRYLTVLAPDYMLCVPSVLESLLGRIKSAGDPWNLRFVGCGGAAFPENAVRILHENGIRVLQSYGATEAGGIGLDTEMTEEVCAIHGTQVLGKIPDNGMMEIRIADDGELLLCCPSLMTEYYKNPRATAAVLTPNGWYRTGDLCRADENGYLYLVGRKTNRIVLAGGENISPEEVERELCRLCPEIVEVMITEAGGWLCAELVLAEDGLPAEQIAAALARYNETVPVYRQIRSYTVRTTPFARNALGKRIRTARSGH